MGTYWKRFTDWKDFVDTAESGHSDIPDSARISRQEDHLNQWHGTANFRAAVVLARSGWKEVGAQIEKFSSKMFAHISQHVVTPEPAYAYEGIDYDIGRLMDGEPEHWITWIESERELKTGSGVCRILYNVAVSAGVSREVIIAKGIAIAALIRLLDFAGIRAELDIADTTRKYSEREAAEVTTVTVKQAAQNTDMDLLAFALAHPSCLRRISFSVSEQLPPEVRARMDIPGAYGHPAEVPIEHRKAYSIYIGESSYGDPHWTDEDAATRWVIDQLKAQGVVLNPPDL